MNSDTFLNALLKWLAIAFIPAGLPLLSRTFAEPKAPLDAERCLFILVLASAGLLEAIFLDADNNERRTLFIIFCLGAAWYALIGYGAIASHAQFAARPYVWPAAIVLAMAYITYKWRILKDQTSPA